MISRPGPASTGALNTLWKIGKSSLGRGFLGLTVGAMYGASKTDSTTDTGKVRDIVPGAVVGLGAGLLLSKTGGMLALGTAAVGGVTLGLSGYGMAKGLGRAGKYAINRPGRALLALGGMIGLGALAMSGPKTYSMSDVDSQGHMEALGSTQNISHVMHHNSTYGLTQGLHRARHRG